MKVVPRRQKNWLLNSKDFFKLKRAKHVIVLCFLFFSLGYRSQIANYVSNGGFEVLYTCSVQAQERTAKNWMCIDSTNFCAFVYNTCTSNIPNTGVGYQMPKSGNGFIRLQLYCPNCPANFKRSNIKNRLKQTLQTGKAYCVKMHVNVQNLSANAIDAFGMYFGDDYLDTVIYNSRLPLTFLTPQVQNPTGNIISDTMNWIPISGTYTANGTEKYLVIANFKSDAATNTVISNANLIGPFGEYFIDDVSCIPLDLPAYAGPDIWGIPTNTVYLGRQSDVGIDEACMWYKLPNITTALDTAAGITVTVGIITNTYVVRQEICGNVKWDTVVVHASGVGISEQELIKNSINVFPNPASDNLNISLNFDLGIKFSKIEIINNLGQLIREEEINFKNKTTSINTTELPNGVYLLNLKVEYSKIASKRFTITK